MLNTETQIWSELLRLAKEYWVEFAIFVMFVMAIFAIGIFLF